jgi:hypothetical protein
MLTAVTDLKRLDIIQHLNGDCFYVDAIEWIGGDNYAVTCIDNNDDLVTFNVDVHTQFKVIMSYRRAITVNTIVMTMNDGVQLTETCSDAELQDAIDGAAHYYFKGRIKTFSVNGVQFDETTYLIEEAN